MTGGAIVQVLVRNRSEVLLSRRSDGADAATGRWETISGPADTDPERAARRELLAGTGLSPAEITLLRPGESFVVDGESGQCHVHPFIFDCERRNVTLDGESDRAEWVPPTAMLERETVPGLWEAYDRVRPTVETVAEDTEHGSTYISIRALEVLRDEAALAAHTQQSDTGDASGEAEHRSVAAVAEELLAARPSMTAAANRIHRAMAAADGPADVASAAHEGIGRASRVDGDAAATAADLLGDAVATLSRSGTVRQTLTAADPERVLVAESRPGRGGVGVAVGLAGEHAVTLTTDTALAHELATREVETLVVGADSVLADGRVVNKVGTRGAALAAAHEGIEVLVVAASDKVSPGTDYDPEERDPTELYDGDASVSVASPTFDVTPPDAIDTIVTERGALDPGDVEEIGDEHRSLREWDAEWE